MITLSNGHKLDFLCSSGALGLDGNGYLWEWPFRWVGALRPEEFTIITKTLTARPRQGNFRWWCPWRCVRFIPGGVVNAVGLTNFGLPDWIKRYYPVTRRNGYKVIVSISPESLDEAKSMAGALSRLRGIVAIEINLSCPNTIVSDNPVEITETVINNTNHPIIVKLGYNNYKTLSRELDQKVEAFDLLNSVPWNIIFPDKKSPLAHLGGGGVSGPVAKEYGRDAIRDCATIRTKIMSGLGIDSVDEVLTRHVMGARAFTFGTAFMKTPWLPNHIASQCRQKMGRR